eukprot:6194009-Pleurochrysis_carterae.AAC.4
MQSGRGGRRVESRVLVNIMHGARGKHTGFSGHATYASSCSYELLHAHSPLSAHEVNTCSG